MTNPLNWTAGPFLWLYVLLALTAGVTVMFGRRGLGPPDLSKDDRVLGLLDLAWLAGGADRVADTVMLAFLTVGAATVDAKGRAIRFEQGPLVLPREVEAFRGLAEGRCTRRQFRKAVWLPLSRVRQGLIQRGLAPATNELAWLRLYTFVLMTMPILFGVAKIWVGSSREKPVGILVWLVLLTAAVGFFWLITPPIRTQRGRAAFERVAENFSRAARAPLASKIAFAFAVSGAAVLAGTRFEAFGKMVRPPRGDGGCGTSGGGGGGCGGGCGGCSG